MYVEPFKASIIFAEYEEFTLNLLREVLTAANFQVAVVTNAADAIAKIGSLDPHAVITDLNFGITGPSEADLLHHIKRNTFGLAKWSQPLMPLRACSSKWDGTTYWRTILGKVRSWFKFRSILSSQNLQLMSIFILEIFYKITNASPQKHSN